MFKVLKKKGEYTMKKTLVIANVMLISSYVFGMNSYDTSNNMDEQNLTSVSNGISDGHIQVIAGTASCTSNREDIMQQEFTELMKAVENNNLAKVKKIVDLHEDMSVVRDLLIASKNKRKMSTKQINQYRTAIFRNSYELVNLSNKGGNTPLVAASIRGYENIAKYLVEHSADVNGTNNMGVSSLLVASGTGHEVIVKYLVEHGADINKADNNGNTPLCAAACMGYAEIVKYLVEHGADINKAGNNGYTPLLISLSRGY